MEYTLTHSRVQAYAAALLTCSLRLTDYSDRCPARMLLAVLFAAAAQLTSVFAAATRLLAVASAETIRKALHAALPGEDELERRLNSALVADVPRALRRRPQRLAVDLTLIPYHGQPLHDEAEVYRGQPKHGTSHFHAYATCYVVYHGQRFTLALCRVRRGDSLARTLRWLLLQAGRAGVRSRLVLLDRGFCSVEVIRYLQAARRPFLMPLVLRGRPVDHPQGPSASRVFLTRRHSGWDRYTMTAPDGRRATVEVCIACDNWRGRRGQRGRRTLVFAFWGLQPSSPDWVRETYRLRFGIETSYRQMNQARIRTCSKDPQVRLLFVGVALILRNVWVYLHHAILSTPRRGRRVLNLELLPLKEMLLWLLRVAEQQWGQVNTIETERHVETAFTCE
jgi:DDE family transposase